MTATAESIARSLDQRLKCIRTADGFETDAGARVFRGKRALTEADVPCIVLVEGPESVSDQRDSRVKLAARFIAEAHDRCDAEHPNDRGHALVRDVKRALFGGPRTRGTVLDGLADSIAYRGKTIGAREDGAALVFASVAIEVHYAEDLAAP